MKCGKVVDEIQISGANDERKMKWIMISTNLHVQSILEYNGDKDTGKTSNSLKNKKRFYNTGTTF